jgi:N-acetylglucosaminyldiphosphoundecaprenol N-acetyl-beta-D-mannosaminyltransferase
MAATAPTAENASIRILDMRIDAISREQAIGRITESAKGGCVLTPNLQHLREYNRSHAVRSAFERCELVVADGTPLIWASRLQGSPLPERIAGSDLIWSLSEATAGRSRTVFLLGGAPGTAKQAAAVLEEKNPGLQVAGTHCPPLGFEHSPQKLNELESAVRRAKPDLVYIGLPLSKQLLVMEALRQVVPAAWLVGLGVSFSFVTGEIDRAPAWMQRVGFEWLYRLAQEPARLGRRYLLEGLPFFAYLMAQGCRRRLAAKLTTPAPSAP